VVSDVDGLGIVICLIFGSFWLWWQGFFAGAVIKSPLATLKPRPLDQYTIENLAKRPYPPTEIKFEKLLRTNPNSTVWLFAFQSDGKRVSGAATLPSGVATTSALVATRKIIVMVHGFVEEKTYYSGFGTDHVASELAKKGFVTLAPDLLGLGESDKGPADSFEDRFQTYTTVLNLLSSVQNICNGCKVGLWGHSNGGQIVLSILTISEKPYVTALWNPVSRFFPFNILFYMDYFDDKGRWLRSALASFEETYDVDLYSFTNFLSRIKAPILLQQGELDQQVPKRWSDELVESMKKEATESAVVYKTYPGADHNMTPTWDRAVTDLTQYYLRTF
jgi:alpha-beta hydrolase superfamily lysophospholipase